jgi:hypothetical protein
MNPEQPQSWLSANIKSITTLIIVILGFAYFFACLFMNVKPDPQILIAVVGAVSGVLGYWFGSSSGSSVKNGIIASNTGNPAVNTGDSATVNVVPQVEQPVNTTA